MKIFYCCLNLMIVCFSFSQEKHNDGAVLLFLDLNSKTITYSISKDTTYISFGIYRKGFVTKKQREDSLKLHSYRGKKRIKTFEDLKNASPRDMPKSDMLPNFSSNYWSIKKPEYLKSVNGIKYITEEEFRVNELNYVYKKIYMIHKLDNGSYLKWELEPIPKE